MRFSLVTSDKYNADEFVPLYVYDRSLLHFLFIKTESIAFTVIPTPTST